MRELGGVGNLRLPGWKSGDREGKRGVMPGQRRRWWQFVRRWWRGLMLGGKE